MAEIALSIRDPDAGRGPSVEVLVTGLSGVAAITVTRTARNRPMQVRGMVRLPVSGAVSRIDFEVPFNAVVSYRAEMFDEGGVSLGFTEPAVLGETYTGIAPADDLVPLGSLYPEESMSGAGVISQYTWMHNPLAPEGAVRVKALDTSAAQLSRPVPSTVIYPRGRRVGVVVSEPRRGLAGFVFDIFCETTEDADKLQAMLGDYTSTTVPVLCLRPGLDFNARVTSPLFLGVEDMIEEDLNVRRGGSNVAQRITGDEVSPPVPGLFIPLLTYADLNAYYSTYAAFNNDNASYLAASRRYELAGSADA